MVVEEMGGSVGADDRGGMARAGTQSHCPCARTHTHTHAQAHTHRRREGYGWWCAPMMSFHHKCF